MSHPAASPDSARPDSANAESAVEFLLSRVNYERTNKPPYDPRSFRLERMRRLLALLGDPHFAWPAVHIAGTKGKGSTATMIASVLMKAGYRVGLYTSPHLNHIEERMQANGQPCPPEALAGIVHRLRPIVERMDREAALDGRAGDGPTYFEITTAAAMQYFADLALDIVVLEVGLGGRLDSTNVCNPILSGITSIGFDHMAQLGNTLAAIAGEKAGIIKPGVEVVTGVTQQEPLAVIMRRANQLGCELIQAGLHYRFEYRVDSSTTWPRVSFFDTSSGDRLGGNLPNVELHLLGQHQAANAAMAIAMLRMLEKKGWRIGDDAIRAGLAAAVCPARVEVIRRDPTVILDVAHNVSSIQALVETIDLSFPGTRRSLVFGSSRDKDIPGMLEILLPKFDRIYFTQYRLNPRAADPHWLMETAKTLLAANSSQVERPYQPQLQLVTDPIDAYRQAAGELDREGLLCVTGSFFLAAELRPWLQAERQADSSCQVESIVNV